MNQFIKTLRIIGLITFVMYIITKLLTSYTLLMSIFGITSAICFGILIVTFVINWLNKNYIK